ncbi:uncharacterized protein LOC128953145 [Oppia nitens]|uniref:uncharacterized protein LOC128953145 n=1 Tax=Oppia nitens TaxID=1686743 RepID=UPI0023D9CB3D|nr:uncharacterized protein LOC128953145 [Oppia nitens]
MGVGLTIIEPRPVQAFSLIPDISIFPAVSLEVMDSATAISWVIRVVMVIIFMLLMSMLISTQWFRTIKFSTHYGRYSTTETPYYLYLIELNIPNETAFFRYKSIENIFIKLPITSMPMSRVYEVRCKNPVVYWYTKTVNKNKLLVLSDTLHLIGYDKDGQRVRVRNQKISIPLSDIEWTSKPKPDALQIECNYGWCYVNIVKGYHVSSQLAEVNRDHIPLRLIDSDNDDTNKTLLPKLALRDYRTKTLVLLWKESFQDKFHQTEPSALYDDLNSVSFGETQETQGQNPVPPPPSLSSRVRTQLPILNPKSYNGTTNPTIWLNHYDLVADANMWDDTIKLKRVIGSLEGAAHLWYQNQRIMNKINNWQQFRTNLINNFTNTMHKILVTQEIFDATQKNSFDEYWEEKFGVIKLTNPGMTDTEIISNMLNGMVGDLKDEVTDKMITNPCETVEEFKGLVKRICDVRLYQRKEAGKRRVRFNYNPVDNRPKEQNAFQQQQSREMQQMQENIRYMKRLMLRGNQFAPKEPVEISETKEDTKEEKRRSDTNWTKTVKCYKCNKIGHIARDCRVNNNNKGNGLKEQPKERKGKEILLLNNKRYELGQYVKLNVEVDNEIYIQDFYIFDEIKYSALLGLDFCRKSKLKLDFGNEDQIDWINSDFIIQEPDSTLEVRLRQDYHIPNETMTNAKCEIDTSNLPPNTQFGFLKPVKRLYDDYQIVIQETLIDLQKPIDVILYNSSKANKYLCKNFKIALMYLISYPQYGCEENYMIESVDDNKKQFHILTTDNYKRQKMFRLLEKNRDLFGESVLQLGKAVDVEHEIKLTTEEPVRLRAYRNSPKEKEIIRQQVKEMLDANVIEESKSPYSFPVVLVKKKNGKIRFCVDYRKLNSITIKDRHPLPLINDALAALEGSKYFTVMDLLSGYWNIHVKVSDRPKTAFITPDGLYQFKVMPFGLTNAPATFQRYMQKVLRNVLYQFVVVYLDDIIIFSNTFDEHLRHVESVLKLIREYDLRLGIEKCEFLCKEVKYLGHIVSSDGIKPDEDKIKSVKAFPIPKKVRDVQSFLGLANYYRVFVQDYAFVAEPLTNLLRKDVKFNWDIKCQKAFDELKNRLITAPILAQYQEGAPIEIFTDACGYGMSAILGQIQNGKHVVISYNSKMFNSAQLNYGITEKECLAIVWAVERYRHYIYGEHFVVYSDHNPLQYIRNLKNPNRRLMHWRTILEEYDFEVKYKKGKLHNNADALSRYPYEKPDDWEPVIPVLINPTINIIEKQDSDKWCKELKEKIKNNQQSKSLSKFIIENEILYRISYDDNRNRRLQLCLPKELRRQILQDLHDNELSGAHLGFEKTYGKIKERFFWPHCEKSIRKYVNNCESCQLNKVDNKLEKGMLQPIDANEPFEIVGVDILGPLSPTSKGSKYIIIMIDLFTKWMETKAVRNVQAITIAKWFVDEVLARHGAIKKVLTDNARYFISDFMEEVFKLTASKHVKTTPYSPQSNGTAEKACGTVAMMLKHYVQDNVTNWDQYLPKVTFSYNVSHHKATKVSPFFLLYGREPKVPIDVSYDLPRDFAFGTNYLKYMEETRRLVHMRIIEAHNDGKFRYDAKHRDVVFEEGDLVSLHIPHREIGLSTKLLSQYIGPYKIITRHSPLVYTVQSVHNPRKKFKKVHIRRLRKWNNETIPELDGIDEVDSNNAKHITTQNDNENQLDDEIDDNTEKETKHNDDQKTDNG